MAGRSGSTRPCQASGGGRADARAAPPAGSTAHATGRASARWRRFMKHQGRHARASGRDGNRNGDLSVTLVRGRKAPRVGELSKLAARAEAANAAVRRSRPPKGAPLPPAKISYRSGPAKAEGGRGEARCARGGGKGGGRAETQHAKGGPDSLSWTDSYRVGSALR